MNNFISALLKKLTGGNVTFTSSDNGTARNNRNTDTVIGSGPCVKELRSIASFDKIDVGGAFSVKVKIVKKSQTTLSVTAQSNILPLVQTVVIGDTLIVKMSGSSNSTGELLVEVEMASLSSMDVHGSATVVVADIASDQLALAVSGSADITVSGRVGALTTDVSGSASLDLVRLNTEALKADISGAAHLQAKVHSKVALDVSGAASVVISGGPSKKEVNKSGAANVLFV